MSMTESEMTISEWVKGQEEELAAYRAIGTAEEFKALKDDFWKLNEMCREYSAIGTVEELRELKEKAEPKKPKQQGCYDVKGVFHTWNGINGVPYDLCPNCETNLCTDGVFGRKRPKYCELCGQRLDWE
jgi:hypothetical protein